MSISCLQLARSGGMIADSLIQFLRRFAMAHSNAFNFIHNDGKPQHKTPIYARYKGEANARELCPHVLGYQAGGGTAQGDERVLCYQLAYNGHPAGWRCFDTQDLDCDEPPKPQPPKTHWKGPKYSKKQGSVQTSVDETP